MIFGVIFRVIGTNFEGNRFLTILAKKRGLTPWDFGQNFKFAKTFYIGKGRREMMFGVILRVIGSNFEENRFLADFGQKA